MAAFDSSQPRHRTAVHEAGHTLVAFTNRFRFHYVSIEPILGVLEEYKPLGGVAFDVEHVRARLQQGTADVEQFLMVICGSFVAELEVFGGDLDPTAFVFDTKQINFFLDRAERLTDRDAYQRVLFDRTRALIHESRTALDRIASQLIQQTRLTEAEVAELVKEVSGHGPNT